MSNMIKMIGCVFLIVSCKNPDKSRVENPSFDISITSVNGLEIKAITCTTDNQNCTLYGADKVFVGQEEELIFSVKSNRSTFFSIKPIIGEYYQFFRGFYEENLKPDLGIPYITLPPGSETVVDVYGNATENTTGIFTIKATSTIYANEDDAYVDLSSVNFKIYNEINRSVDIYSTSANAPTNICNDLKSTYKQAVVGIGCSGIYFEPSPELVFDYKHVTNDEAAILNMGGNSEFKIIYQTSGNSYYGFSVGNSCMGENKKMITVQYPSGYANAVKAILKNGKTNEKHTFVYIDEYGVRQFKHQFTDEVIGDEYSLIVHGISCSMNLQHIVFSPSKIKEHFPFELRAVSRGGRHIFNSAFLENPSATSTRYSAMLLGYTLGLQYNEVTGNLMDKSENATGTHLNNTQWDDLHL
jgi:hypothetical protein